jgi:hypothetical protein
MLPPKPGTFRDHSHSRSLARVTGIRGALRRRKSRCQVFGREPSDESEHWRRT